MNFRTLTWGEVSPRILGCFLVAGLALAPVAAVGAEIGDGAGRSITRNLTGGSGALLSSGNLVLDGAAGQAAAGFSVGGTLALTHGAFGGQEAEGEPEGEGEGEGGEGEGEGEGGEGEGEGEVCSGQGPGVSAEVGASVCFGLPGSCAVDPVAPLYMWSKDGSPEALVEEPGVLTGVNSPTLCFESVTVEDSGVYTLSYETGNKALVQYSVALTVTPSALPISGVMFLALMVALLAGLASLSIRREATVRNDGATRS